MGFMTIDGQRVEFTNEPNVLTVIRNAEIDIPTLCYHSELSIYGACRLCTVENDRGKTFASCAEPPRDGMVIYTNTPRLMRYRRTILELLLAAHDRDCTTCVKSGECHLLELAHRMGVDRIRFKNREAKYPIDESSPAIVRNPNKCILCGDCVRMCDNVQSVNAIDFAYRGTSTHWRTPTPLWWRRWLRRSAWRWATSSASPRAKTSWASWSMPCTVWASMRCMTPPTARTSP